MENQKTLILNGTQIRQRISRIAYQIYEDNFEEKDIIIAGILKSGFLFAQRLADEVKRISPLQIRLIEIKIDKNNQVSREIELPLSKAELKGKVIIVVDDVLNSGKTLMYSLRPFLDADIKKIRTVLLVDRDHKRYPVFADFVGITLSTTLKEHISVEFGKSEEAVYLG